jgi:hypothetical protein
MPTTELFRDTDAGKEIRDKTERGIKWIASSSLRLHSQEKSSKAKNSPLQKILPNP